MHIAAVKKPWRRSNRYNALQQMLVTNLRNDKLAAARIDFQSRGMLNGTCLGEVLQTLAHGSDDAPDGDSTDEESVGEDDTDKDADEDENGPENDRCGPVDGPPILSEVSLALKKGALCTCTINLA